jgi:hypothetical protein
MTDKKPELVMSYLTMRRVIGILGTLLPFVLVAGGLITGPEIKGSISAYYFSNMQDIFVGLMCAVALFLITYKGYDTADKYVTSISGGSALLVALFPTLKFSGSTIPAGPFMLPNNITAIIHYSSAVLFLLGLAAISFFLFTRSDASRKKTREKLARNRAYRVCGILIAAAVVGMAASRLIMNDQVFSSSRVVLILETIALLAFGFSWLVKGETLWKDAPEAG